MMNKILKTIAPVILVCFVFTMALPLKAEAFWPYPDTIKAEDNEHVTYQIDKGENIFWGIREGDRFIINMSVYYDGKNVKKLNIQVPASFELVSNSISTGFNYINHRFSLIAASKAGSYSLLFEGEADSGPFKFSVPVTVNQSGYLSPLGFVAGATTIIFVIAMVYILTLGKGKS